MLEPTERLSVTLEAQQWQRVISVLDEFATHRVAAPLILAISAAAQQHLAARGPAPAVVEASEDAPADHAAGGDPATNGAAEPKPPETPRQQQPARRAR